MPARGPNGPSRWPLYWDKWRNLEYGSAKEIRGAGAGIRGQKKDNPGGEIPLCTP